MLEGVVEKGTNGYLYKITERKCDAEECEGTIVYGIRISSGEEKFSEVEDISSVYAVVEKLFELCIRNEVMPEILAEVIEDYLV